MKNQMKRKGLKVTAFFLAVLLLCSSGMPASAADLATGVTAGTEAETETDFAQDRILEEGDTGVTQDAASDVDADAVRKDASANETAVQPVEETQVGEGVSWDDSTKTLTVKAADISAVLASITAYKATAEMLVVNTEGNIPSNAFKDFKNVAGIQIIRAGDIETKAFYNCGNNPKLRRDITIEQCGNIAAQAFYRLNGTGGTLTIGTCGDIAANAFQNAKLNGDIQIETCGDIATNAFNSSTASGASYGTLTIGTCGNIADNALKGLASIQSAEIGTITGEIEKSLFYNFTKLTALEIGVCGDIPENAISNSKALETLAVGTCGAFGKQSGLTALKTLTIGECNSIGGFSTLYNSGIPALETIEIGKCTSIEDAAFYGGGSLKSVKIEACETIGAYAFHSAYDLAALEIGTCNSIGDFAFNAAGNKGDGIEKVELKEAKLGRNAFFSAKIHNVTLDGIQDIGSQAFKSATITNLTLSDMMTLADESFASLKGLETLTIENLDTIDADSFKIYDTEITSVKTITLSNVRYIGKGAFENFKDLETVTIEGNCEYIGAHAFSGCTSLKKINVAENTKLGYSNSFVNADNIRDRVEAILDGTFELVNPDIKIETITPEGWTSAKTGVDNSDKNVGDTQITKEAKWADAEATVADVLLKAYYTVNQQMDFVFVADCSNSMAGFGSADAMNSNFYNMQSKLKDVSEEILSVSELDTRVAFSTFGEGESAISEFFGKDAGQNVADYIWNDIVNYYSNTNYSTGLAGALELVKQNKAAGRNTTVIFISDGQPYYDGTSVPEDYYGEKEAEAIRAEGVQIVSVLQQVPEDSLESSKANMEKIADVVFSSTDLKGFSQAMNDAVDYAYTTFTFTDTVDPAFSLDQESIEASVGDVTVGTDDEGRTTITWTITDAPFEEHTLSFKENLNADEKGIRPTGDLDTNEGDAAFAAGETVVNTVETPVLSRGTELSVEKVWKNDTKDVRPDSVEIELLRDGEVFETVTLTEKDGWKYTWEALDPVYTWSVQEAKVPEGYQSSVSQDGSVFIITNTYEKTVTTDPAPDTKPSGTPDKAGANAVKTGDQSNLALWTVIVLAAVIAAVVCLAYRRKNRRGQKY